MDQISLIKVLTPHKKHLTTVSDWNDYSTGKNLPTAAQLIYTFGSWNKVKGAFSLSVKKRYTSSEIENLLRDHTNHLRYRHKWDNYAKEHDLPSASTLIRKFETWNNVLEHFNINTDKVRSDTYSQQEIKKILEQHASGFVNRKLWDDYAKENKLPTYKTIKKHFSYEEIMEIINNNNVSKEEELIQIAKHHKVFFRSSRNSWDEYATSNNLPKSSTYIWYFKTWKNAKKEIRKAVPSL